MPHDEVSPLARAEGRRERRLWQVRPPGHALRPLHGSRGHSLPSRHRLQHRARPSAGALEAPWRYGAPISSSTAPKACGACMWSRSPPAARSNAERHLYEKVVLVVEGPRLDGSLARWPAEEADLRMAEGLAVLDPAECPPSLRQRDEFAGAPPVRHVRAEHDEPLRQSALRLQLPVQLHRPLCGQRRLFQAQGRHRARSRARPRHAAHQFHSRCDQCELPLDNRRSPGYRRIEPHMAGNRFYCGLASTRQVATPRRTSMPRRRCSSA